MTVGLLSFANLLSGFNGGKSQVNPNFLQIGGDYPFLNAMKTAQIWSPNSSNSPVTPDILDANGYPTSIVNGGVNTVFYVPTQASRPGNYVITWTGNGTVTCGMSNTAQGGTTKTGSGGNGRYVFSTTDNRFVIGISALPVTNLQVFHADDETAINAGQVFGAKFKQRLIEANFGVIRFLNWNDCNSSNVTTWATRKPAGYVFYSGSELRSSLYAGTTSLTGTKYSVSAPSTWSGVVDKATIHVLVGQSYSPTAATFTNGSSSVQVPSHGLAVNAKLVWDVDFSGGSMPANFSFRTTYFVVSVIDANHIAVSATQGGTAIVAGAGASGNLFACPYLTLNVGSTGDVAILSEFSGQLTFQTNSYPVGGTFQSLATLVYDADLNAWIKQGGDVAIGSGGIDNGCPPELMVQLCAEVGAHFYAPIPALTLTPMTDYVPQLATYIRDHGPSWMIPRFEGPNELWNDRTYVTGYANAKATAYSWGADFHNWYGKAMSTLGQAVSTVYGNDRTKYQILCGVQTSQGDTSGDRANSNPRLASTLYLAQTPQSPYTATAASNWVTHVCCAQYMTPSDYGAPAETTLATAFASGDLTAPGTYVDTLSSGSGPFNLTNLAALYAGWKTWAQSFGIQKMCGYEGGYSPDYTGGGASQVDKLRAAGKLATGLQGYTTTNYSNFVGLTGGGFTAEFPSCFQLSSNINLTGYSTDTWSVLEDIYQTPNPPQWNAIVAFNH